MWDRSKLVILFVSAAIVLYGLLGGMLDRVSAGDDPYGPLAVFTEVVDKIRSDYVEQPDMRQAFNGALLGMMEALDPYSSFVEAATFSELEERASKPASAGIVVSKRYGYVYVVSVAAGSPAAQAGIRTGDLLESIDGIATTRMSLWESGARLRGEDGAVVKLRVVRARRTEPTNLDLVLSVTKDALLSASIDEGGIGILRIPGFSEGTADSVAKKLRMFDASSVAGILVDLRGNAGGILEEAARSGDLLLPTGKKIVTVSAGEGASREYASMVQPVFSGLPIVLLVDGGTSGAAEVFAAALQDNLEVTVVGERTNGRGSVQKEFPLEDGARLFITTELLMRASGEPLQAKSARQSGVKPDVRSPSQDFATEYFFDHTTEDLEESLAEEFYRGLDQAVEEEQLKDALEVIRENVVKKAA